MKIKLTLAKGDTIAAISTPLGEGGIGIVRLSGKKALTIANKLFKGRNGATPSKLPSYTIHYGHIIRNKEILDEVILSIMRKPKSYTREDVVEINCHGGILPLRKTLEAVLECGARLAEPGEFTKRAFLNGRIDLAQAEAVINIVEAKTELALKSAMSQLKGAFSKTVKELKDETLELLTLFEAELDFPEEKIDNKSLINHSFPELLKEFGLDKMRVEIDGKNIKEQSDKLDNKINFELAFKLAIISFMNDNDDWEDDYLIVKGCGHLECCGGLFWDLMHKGEDIIISNIRWTRGRRYSIEDSVEGVYTVKIEDYRDEVLKLKEIYDNKLKNPDI